MDYDNVLSSIEQPDFREKKVKKYQSTDDIIKDLIFCFKEYNHQAKPIAEKFGTGRIGIDSKNIYTFIKKNIAYDAEPEKDQTTRSFSRIIHDKWGDCKHTATIVGSIGWNEGYNVIFRVVRYLSKGGDFIYHVYTVLEDKVTGRQVIVDPLQSFDYEKKYDKKIGDFKAINNMTLTRLTGTETQIMGDQYDAHQVGMICGNTEIVMTPMGFSDDTIGDLEVLQGIGRKSKEQRAANKEKRKKIFKKGLTVFKKVNLAPIRLAFNGLLLVNFHHIASRMQKAIEMGKGNKIDAFAKKFGYNPSKLRASILKGSKKRGIGAIDENVVHHDGAIGFVVTSAAVVAASTALAAAIGLLKSLGLGKKGDEKVTSTAVADMTSDAGGGSNVPTQQFSSGESGGSGGGSGGGGGAELSQQDATLPGSSLPESANGGDGEPSSSLMDKIKAIPTPVIVIGVGALIYFGAKKFKILK